MSSIPIRGLLHIVVGLSIPIAALFLPRIVLLISLGVVTFILLTVELLRFKVPSINRVFLRFYKPLLREKEISHLTGASYLFSASLLAFLVFPRDIAVLAISFMAVGDAVAALVGKRIGKRKLLGKTLEGDLASFISCLAVGFIFYSAGLELPLLTIVVGSVVAAIVEAVPIPINDNLTIPLLSGVVMTVMQI